jgi:hypothetical protein
MNALGLFLLSAAALAFEINLTRIFSVSQFYHFAFMTVSLALLGYGASGSLLSLAPGLARRPRRTLVACAYGFALTAVGGYGVTLLVPFDSFRVALEPTQWGVLALHYVVLALPFLFTGTATGLLLALHPETMGRTYAANMAGSAAGCLLALVAPPFVGAVGTVLLSAGMAGLAALFFIARHTRSLKTPALSIFLTLMFCLAAFRLPDWLDLRLSPYKSLSYALLYPDSRLIFQRWNSFSRVDVVDAAAIRSLPGQGFACTGQPPPQRGLFVDGDNLSPITRVTETADLQPITDCLLTALPYRLRPRGNTAVVNARGGFDLLVALAEGVESVAAVEPNPLVVEAVQDQGAWAGNLYDHPQVARFEEEGRAFLARPGPRYAVILLSLPGTYHPVTSGAYSLREDYTYTVEGITAALERLDDEGLLAMVRWLQTPPSESLRAFALAVDALERVGEHPADNLVALRSYNQMLILARRNPFTSEELHSIRAFAAPRAFDLVYAPDIVREEVNRYNVLPEPSYYRAFTALIESDDRPAWFTSYGFAVEPPTDDRPFFNNFFRWEQARAVLEMAGHTWQPFGGAGYFVLLALLIVAILAAVLLVLLPLVTLRSSIATDRGEHVLLNLLPFGLLGLAYLLVEIPLLQRFILLLGHPTYAMALVLGALLLFSGVGSLISSRVHLEVALGSLVGVIVLSWAVLPTMSEILLRVSLPLRMLAAVAELAPLGILMGIPFPRCLNRLQRNAPGLVPWAWGVNGALSVIASVLAALTSLSWGFGAVLGLGALCYLGAGITTAVANRDRPPALLSR